jgi:arylsulfatase A-like enzyme
MIGALQATLQRTGQANNTVFVFSSDNGYHMGDYSLRPGKQTAFDTDVRVPLIVAGPGIASGITNRAVVENVDLAPTFDDLAGAPAPPQVDGRSIAKLLHGATPRWRSVALIEHHRPAPKASDPDVQTTNQGTPPTYEAIRTAKYTYIRYNDGEREFYNRTRDPYQLDNIVATLSPSRLAALDRIVHRLRTCHGQSACWAAGRPVAG